MRQLNEEEKAIIAKKEQRMGKELLSHARTVEYRTVFPRSTICILASVLNPTVDATTIGISMRAKDDEAIEGVGEVHAFVRALEAL